MTNNKIPLALGYDPSTGNASGLEEFTLDLSNVGGVCDTPPTPNQSLVFNGSDWCPSTIITGGGGGGGGAVNSVNDLTGSVSLYFSSLSGTAIDSPSNNEVLVYQSEKWINQTVAEAGLATAANLTATTDIANAALPRVGGVDKNSLVITTDTSSVSSLSGASGTIPYFEGTTPVPALQPITTILQNAAVRVEDKSIGSLSDVKGSTPDDNSTIIYSEDETKWLFQPPEETALKFGNKSVSSVSGSYTVSNVVTVPPGFTGKGDSTVDSFIIFSGTDASSTEYVGTRWGANWVEGPQNIATTDGNYFAYVSATTTGDTPGASGVAAVALNANALQFIENGSATTATFGALTVNGTAPSSTIAPTLGGHLTTKTYVDAITGAPKTLLAIGSGTDNVANTEVDLKWQAPVISDADITISSSSTITFATAGTYQIDVAARTTGDGRIEGQIRTYLDTDGEGWVEQTSHIATDYTSRDTDQDAGTTNLNTMFALGAGHKLKFTCKTNSDNNATVMQAGTILRIVGWT